MAGSQTTSLFVECGLAHDFSRQKMFGLAHHVLFLLLSTGGTAGQQPVLPIPKLIGMISAGSDDSVSSILIGTTHVHMFKTLYLYSV